MSGSGNGERRQTTRAATPWFGKLPEGWKAVKCKRLFKEVDERSIDGSEELLSVSHITGVTPRSEKNVTMFQSESLVGYKLCQVGDIAANTMWMWQGAIGVSSHFGVISPSYNVYRQRAGQYLPQYLDKLLRHPRLVDEYNSLSTGIQPSRQRLYPDKFFSILLPLPPLPVQRRIVAFLAEKTVAIERLVEVWKEEISELEELKKAIIYTAVTRGIDGTSHTESAEITKRHWFGKLPEGWKARRLKHVCELIGSGTTPQSGNALFYGGNTNWIQSGDLHNTDVILNTEKHVTDFATRECSALHIYKAPFVVVAMYGASIGNVAISEIDACVNQACCVLKPSESFDLKFAYYSLIACKSDLLRQSAGGTQPNISQQKIREETIPVPSLSGQRKIAAYLDEKCAVIDRAIASKRKSIEELGALKSRLIADAVTGAVEIP